MENKKRNAVLDLTVTALMCVLIIISSWITVPFTIPFTLQTLAIVFALEFAGGKKGTVAIILYLLLGAVGLPVFSGFTGGLGRLAGPTGGYLVGFVLTGLLYWATQKIKLGNFFMRILRLLLCIAAYYVLGTAWFVIYQQTDLGSALMVCVVPFLIPDLAKTIVAAVIAKRVKAAVGKK